MPRITHISASLGALSDWTTLTVYDATLVVTPTSDSVAINSTSQFAATYSGSIESDVTTQADWSSSLPSIATVDLHTGLATGISAGVTTISATFGGLAATSSLTVFNPVVPDMFTLSTVGEGTKQPTGELNSTGPFTIQIFDNYGYLYLDDVPNVILTLAKNSEFDAAVTFDDSTLVKNIGTIHTGTYTSTGIPILIDAQIEQGQSSLAATVFTVSADPSITTDHNIMYPWNYDPPYISYFFADPSTITRGTPAVLYWDTYKAESVSIDQGIGTVATAGSVEVNPVIASTTYTLTLTSGAFTDTRQTTVTVTNPLSFLDVNAVGYFSFDTNASPNSGTFTGMGTQWLTFAPGHVNNGVKWTGGGTGLISFEYIDLNSLPFKIIESNYSNDFTIDFWYLDTGASNTGMGFLALKDQTYTNLLTLELIDTKKFRVSGADGFISTSTWTQPNTNVWTHLGIVVTKSTGAIKLYINGIFQENMGNMTFRNSSTMYSGRVMIGGQSYGTPANSMMDELRFSNVARTAAEMALAAAR